MTFLLLDTLVGMWHTFFKEQDNLLIHKEVMIMENIMSVPVVGVVFKSKDGDMKSEDASQLIDLMVKGYQLVFLEDMDYEGKAYAIVHPDDPIDNRKVLYEVVTNQGVGIYQGQKADKGEVQYIVDEDYVILA